MITVFLVMVVALILGTASHSCAEEHEMAFKDAEIFIEFNSTNEDAGIQVSLDGDDWRKVTIASPDGAEFSRSRAKGA